MPEYSICDNSIPVDHNRWVVSIMRKPHGNVSEHAFLIVEGRNYYGKAMLQRYDLFENADSMDGKSIIYIKPEIVINSNEVKTALLEDILKGEEVYSISWSITRQQAESLHQDILKDQLNPPIYQLSGNESIFVKSTSNEGHSCFTWAREKLHNLNDERIQLPIKYSDFIVAQTSRYIKGNPEPTSGNCLVM